MRKLCLSFVLLSALAAREASAQDHSLHQMSENGSGWKLMQDGVVFLDKVTGGVIPREFIPSVEYGIRQAAASGVIGGYPFRGIGELVRLARLDRPGARALAVHPHAEGPPCRRTCHRSPLPLGLDRVRVPVADDQLQA